MFRRSCWVVLVLFNVAFAIMALYFIFKGGVVTPASASLEYKDFVAILLTGLGVMIALGALLIAVLAIWTYKNAIELIVEAAQRAAEKAARAHVEATVPGMVDDVIRFKKEDAGDSDPNAIATAYSKEGL